ncbi:MAG: thiolase family protein [Elusimicrobia bacterium]|nr:thiolase family protein [Elusimicrobiota bacterium]
MMDIRSRKIVLCTGVRTPIGHIARALSQLTPDTLLKLTIEGLLQKTSLYPHAVDGVIAGWVGQGSSAPNIARIALLNSGLPEKAHAITVQANCVSGMESVCSAARHILVGEGELYIAGGTESMSNFPYLIRGPRSEKDLRSLDSVKENWSKLWENPNIEIADCIDEGLTDPVQWIGMAQTAEVCAQMYSISRDAQDQYAFEGYRRCLESEKNGFYESHLVPVQNNGTTLLKADEYPFLRESLVEKPKMLSKAPLMFESSSFTMKNLYEKYGQHIFGKKYLEGQTRGTVTLFNSCARSDGAAAVIVASEERARDLNLEILAELESWAFWGNNPAHMGVAPVFSMEMALKRAQISFDQLDDVELHEAFAATCLSIFKVGKEKFKQMWEQKFEKGQVNPHGGTIALGHPLAATGTRVILNALYEMKRNPKVQWAGATACAAGGLGGAVILKRYQGQHPRN